MPRCATRANEPNPSGSAFLHTLLVLLRATLDAYGRRVNGRVIMADLVRGVEEFLVEYLQVNEKDCAR